VGWGFGQTFRPYPVWPGPEHDSPGFFLELLALLYGDRLVRDSQMLSEITWIIAGFLAARARLPPFLSLERNQRELNVLQEPEKDAPATLRWSYRRWAQRLPYPAWP